MSAFGLYIHWPYCAAKCPYCDFNSHVRTARDEDGWRGGIVKEMALIAALQGERRPRLDSIFFGGGTPSLMGEDSVGALLETAARYWRFADDIEITLESNPASAEAARFAGYRAAGVNRLSLGVQSFDDAALKFLGRLHDGAEAKAALKLALATFERVSFDLIYARPGQDGPSWRAELLEALAYGSEHLSLYQLTIEPATPFATMARRGSMVMPDEEIAAELFDLTQQITQIAGLPAYEISNHARPGAESRHNLIYWRYGAYAGLGPGAHGRLDLFGRRFATANQRKPERWLSNIARIGHGFATVEKIDAAAAAREQLVMGLRLSEGLNLADHAQRWDRPLDRQKIDALAALDLVRRNGSQLTATNQGKLVLNRLIAELAD